MSFCCFIIPVMLHVIRPSLLKLRVRILVRGFLPSVNKEATGFCGNFFHSTSTDPKQGSSPVNIPVSIGTRPSTGQWYYEVPVWYCALWYKVQDWYHLIHVLHTIPVHVAVLCPSTGVVPGANTTSTNTVYNSTVFISFSGTTYNYSTKIVTFITGQYRLVLGQYHFLLGQYYWVSIAFYRFRTW